jgi:hypothetical protein
MMERVINEYLPRVNFVLLLVLFVMASVMGMDYFMEKRKKGKGFSVEEVSQSPIIIVIKDGIFYVLDGKEIVIESMSPLVIRHQGNVFRKEGRFYLYTKGSVIYIFDINNEGLIGERKGGSR